MFSRYFTFICLTLGMSVALAQKNPMQPPAFALLKYHQERLRRLPNSALPSKEVKPLVLNSILYSASRKIAIVNDKMLAIGEKVDVAKLLKISRDRVKLIKKGKIINLLLQDGESLVHVTRAKGSL